MTLLVSKDNIHEYAKIAAGRECYGMWDCIGYHIKYKHIKRYLISYIEENNEFPEHIHDFGFVTPLKVEIGLIDFKKIENEILGR